MQLSNFFCSVSFSLIYECQSAFFPLVLYLLQIVSERCSEEVQMQVLSLLHLATEHSVMTAVEFEQQGGMLLIQRVLRTPQAAVGEKIMKVGSN